MHVELPSAVERRLGEQARRQGLSPEAYAARLLQEALAASRLDEVLARTQAAFSQANASDDEVGELLEHEKHAAREHRRQAGKA